MMQKADDDDDDDSPQHPMHHICLKDLRIVANFLTSLRTWASSFSQFFTPKFEIFGSIGLCCKISINMVGDCCWLAGSLKDLQLLYDLLCFETLMMQAFYRKCCMQQIKEND
jgi:hypothetical protein